MTRRTDGSIAFGYREWLAFATILVAIAVAWGRMGAETQRVSDVMDVRLKAIESDIAEIKEGQKEHRQLTHKPG